MVKPLLFITLALVIVGGILYFYQEHNSNNFKNSGPTGQKLLEEIDTKSLSKINIRGEDFFVSLIQLQGGAWKEESLNFDADISSIKDLLIKLSQIKLGDLITSNSEHHNRFKLVSHPENIEDWDKGLHGNSITLLKGDNTIILSLLLGNNRNNGEGQYIRHAGSNKVFLIPERFSINTNVNNWLDKELLNLETKLISEIKLKDSKDRILNFKRKDSDGEWEMSESNDSTVKKKIQNVLDRLSNLSFTKLLSEENNFENKSNSSENILSITLFDGRLFTIKLLKDDNTNENYFLNLRMGILQDASDKNNSEETVFRQEMESFNKKMNRRFFEISSWEANDLLMKNE